MSDQLNDCPTELLHGTKIVQQIDAKIDENTIQMRIQQGIIDSVNHEIIHHKNWYDPEGKLETMRDEPRAKVLVLETENKTLNWVRGLLKKDSHNNE